MLVSMQILPSKVALDTLAVHQESGKLWPCSVARCALSHNFHEAPPSSRPSGRIKTVRHAAFARPDNGPVRNYDHEGLRDANAGTSHITA
jgi:hypothetical protein